MLLLFGVLSSFWLIALLRQLITLCNMDFIKYKVVVRYACNIFVVTTDQNRLCIYHYKYNIDLKKIAPNRSVIICLVPCIMQHRQ